MTSKQRDRKCATCRHYQPSPLWRKGWCRNPLLFDPTTNHLVESESLSCARAFIDYWEPRGRNDKPEVGPSVAGNPRVAPSIPLTPTGPGGAPLRTPPRPEGIRRAATAEALSPAREKPPLTLVRPPAEPDITLPLDPAAGPAPAADPPAPGAAEAEGAVPDPGPVGATIRIQGVLETPRPPEAAQAANAGRTRLILLALIAVGVVVLLFLPQIRTRLNGLVATPVPPTKTAVPLVLPPLVPTPLSAPPTATALPPPPPPAPPAVLAVGGFAQVVNTGGSGLRIRDNPTTQGRVLAKVPDGARLQLKEGPRNDGKRDWWRVIGFDNKGTLGWCSAEYLKPVP